MIRNLLITGVVLGSVQHAMAADEFMEVKVKYYSGLNDLIIKYEDHEPINLTVDHDVKSIHFYETSSVDMRASAGPITITFDGNIVLYQGIDLIIGKHDWTDDDDDYPTWYENNVLYDLDGITVDPLIIDGTRLQGHVGHKKSDIPYTNSGYLNGDIKVGVISYLRFENKIMGDINKSKYWN